MVIANCGQLGLDWRDISLSDYLEGLDAHNEAHEREGDGEPASPEFREQMRRIFAAEKKGAK